MFEVTLVGYPVRTGYRARVAGPEEVPPSEVNARTLADDAAALQELGERLVYLTDAELAAMGLDGALADAITEARRLKPRSEAMRRQLQYLGKLMRRADTDAIAILLTRVTRNEAAVELQQRADGWATRLMEQGDTALHALLAERPDIPRQLMRQLMRAAKEESTRLHKSGPKQLELVARLRRWLPPLPTPTTG